MVPLRVALEGGPERRSGASGASGGHPREDVGDCDHGRFAGSCACRCVVLRMGIMRLSSLVFWIALLWGLPAFAEVEEVRVNKNLLERIDSASGVTDWQIIHDK